MAVALFKRSVVTPSTVTPPHLNRHQSYSSSRTPAAGSTSVATNYLSSLRTRSMSPCPTQHTVKSSNLPSTVDAPPNIRRTSWEECKQQRDPSRYISFPEFDESHHDQEYRERQ